ncbi:uncharacterized protein LOC129233980 [Uloborus diversus]|uniref:uncharacterized protein LOC129233980 n=1 Tax=Uloborus diversus TaxID=327109 RepID=UPI00240A769B|nr:uncharacterized protein LOC129233980 [Uloborus diversus]
MHDAMTAGKSILGCKGQSALLPIPSFNVISGFVRDYMHGIFLGVTKYLVSFWFDSRNHSKDFFLYELILKFVTEVQIMYGEESMTYNVHLLLHFTTSVVNWEPLWCHSMFVYEGFNSTLQSFIMGTRGIKSRAVKKFLLHQEISNNNVYQLMC